MNDFGMIQFLIFSLFSRHLRLDRAFSKINLDTMQRPVKQAHKDGLTSVDPKGTNFIQTGRGRDR